MEVGDLPSHDRSAYRLRFRSLGSGQVDLTFPCDSIGRVDLDSLGERVLNRYLYARAVVGGAVLAPVVEVEGA
jgi:hypothetical protein